jgi:hypothetical protein
MTQPTDVANVCCVAIELSKSSWVIAFSPPADGGRASVHQVAARDINPQCWMGKPIRLIFLMTQFMVSRPAARPLASSIPPH